MDDEHRHPGVVHDGIGDRRRQEALEPVPVVRSDDDHVGVAPGGGVDDRVGRVAHLTDHLGVGEIGGHRDLVGLTLGELTGGRVLFPGARLHNPLSGARDTVPHRSGRTAGAGTAGTAGTAGRTIPVYPVRARGTGATDSSRQR